MLKIVMSAFIFSKLLQKLYSLHKGDHAFER